MGVEGREGEEKQGREGMGTEKREREKFREKGGRCKEEKRDVGVVRGGRK